MTKFVIQPKITVELPPDKILIDKKEYEHLLDLSDLRCWWTSKDLAERYHQKITWFSDNIFQNPRFTNKLRNQCVIYPGQGVKGYRCEPKQFSEFMRKYFSEIAYECQRRKKNE